MASIILAVLLGIAAGAVTWLVLYLLEEPVERPSVPWRTR